MTVETLSLTKVNPFRRTLQKCAYQKRTYFMVI